MLLEADLIKPELLIIVEIVDDHHPRDADNFYGKPFNLTGYVGAPSDFKLVSIPFYFYGAGPEWTTVVMDGEQEDAAGDLVTLSQEKVDEFYAKVPVATMQYGGHPMGSFLAREQIDEPRCGDNEGRRR